MSRYVKNFAAFLPPMLVLVLSFQQYSAYAQTDANRGQIVGTVYDANGAVVPNAHVKFKNSATGFSRDVKTNESGQYRGILLDPGEYEIVATSAGFAPATMTGVILTVGSAMTVDVRLAVQATSTTVEVSASGLSDVSTSSSATVNSTAITNLPINGRRFQDFALLTPSVQVDPSRSNLSFAGQRGINSNVMLDGADYNQPFFGGIRGGERSNSIITVPQAAIQEFQVIATGYSAEYGRSSGGILNTITKSGQNQIHGEGFYQLRHRALSGKNPIFNVRPSETLHQYGGGAGGPIKRDKLFWFGAAEAQYSTIPRQVLFPQLAGRTATPATQEAFDFYRSEERKFTQDNNAFAVLGRGDYQMDNGDRLTMRYNFSKSTENNAVTVGGSVNPFTNGAISNEGAEKDRLHNGGMQYTKLFSARLVNDLKFNVSDELRPRLANAEVPGITNFIGSYGTRSFLPTTQFDRRYQLTDGLSLIAGKHTLKFGVDYNYLTTGQTFGFNQFGTFNYIGASDVPTVLELLSVGGMVPNRFDSTNFTYSRQLGNLLADYDLHQIATFVQDSWRLHPQFTVDLGFRWEGQLNPSVEANNTTLVNRVKDFPFPIGMSVDPTTIKDSLKQFMPRGGFAWTPITGEGRTVVRGYAGLFYAASPMLLFSGPSNNFRTPPGDVSLVVGGAGAQTSLYNAFLQAGVNLNSSPLGGLPVIPLDVVQRASAIALGGTARDPFLGASVTSIASDFANPRSFQTGIGFESELVSDLIVGAYTNLVNTVHLERNRDYNLPVPVVLATDQSRRPNFGLTSVGGGAPPRAARPVPQLSVITVRDSSARSLYRNFTLQGQYRKKRLQFQAFYTWSETFSDDDNERDTGGSTATNQFNLLQEYGYSNLDIRHQFTSNATTFLPWGFQLSGIFRVRTGLPLNARTGADSNNDGQNNDRPFTGPGDQIVRNAFRNRGTSNFDLRASKDFRITEGVRIQFSAEFFNLLNAENVVFGGNAAIYGNGFQPNGAFAPIDARFMRLRLANGNYDTNNQQIGSPRQIQFGLRCFF